VKYKCICMLPHHLKGLAHHTEKEHCVAFLRMSIKMAEDTISSNKELIKNINEILSGTEETKIEK